VVFLCGNQGKEKKKAGLKKNLVRMQAKHEFKKIFEKS
jgi:hypothetical protein